MTGSKEPSRRRIGVADDADGPESVAEPEPGPRRIGETSNGPDPGSLEAAVPPGPRPALARQETSPDRAAVPPSVRYADMFRMYDTNNDNLIDHIAMVAAMGQLGLLNGLNPKSLAQVLGLKESETAFRTRNYAPQEFIAHCERLNTWQARQAREHRIKVASKVPGVPRGAERAELLRRVYSRYAVTPGQGRLVTDSDFAEPRMTNIQLQRVVQDMGLMQPNGPLSIVSVDLVFTKCKTPGSRKMGYPSFLKALAALAEESGADVWAAANALGLKLRPAEPPPMHAVFGRGYRYDDDPGTYYADQELPVDQYGVVQALPRLQPQPSSSPDRTLLGKPRSKYFSQKSLGELTGDGNGGGGNGVSTSLPNGLGGNGAVSISRGRGQLLGGNGLSPLPREAFGAAMTDNGEAPSEDPLLGGGGGGAGTGAGAGGAPNGGRTLGGIASLPQGQAVLAAFKNSIAESGLKAGDDGGPLAGRPIRAFQTPPSGNGDSIGESEGATAAAAASEAAATNAAMQQRMEALEQKLLAQAVQLEEARAAATEAHRAAAAAAAAGIGSRGGSPQVDALSLAARLAACEAVIAEEKAAAGQREAELQELRLAVARREAESAEERAAAARRDQQLEEQRAQMVKVKAAAEAAAMAADEAAAAAAATGAGKGGGDGKNGEKSAVDLDRLAALERRVAALEAAFSTADKGAAATRAAAEAAAERAEQLEVEVAAAVTSSSMAPPLSAEAATAAATAEDVSAAVPSASARDGGDTGFTFAAVGEDGSPSTTAAAAAAAGEDFARLAASLPSALLELDRQIQELQKRPAAASGADGKDGKDGKGASNDAATAKAAKAVAAAAAELAGTTGAVAARNRQLGDQVKGLEQQLQQMLTNLAKLEERQREPSSVAPTQAVAAAAAGKAAKDARDSLLARIRDDISALQNALAQFLKNRAAARQSLQPQAAIGSASAAVRDGGSLGDDGTANAAAEEFARLAAALPAVLVGLDAVIQELQKRQAERASAEGESPVSATGAEEEDGEGGKAASDDVVTAEVARSVAAAAAELAASTNAIAASAARRDARNRQLGDTVKGIEQQLQQLLADLAKLATGWQRSPRNGTSTEAGAGGARAADGAGVGEGAGAAACAAACVGAGAGGAADADPSPGGVAAMQQRRSVAGAAAGEKDSRDARDALLRAVRADINAVQSALARILQDAARQSQKVKAGSAAAAVNAAKVAQLQDLVSALHRELADSGARVNEALSAAKDAKDGAAAAQITAAAALAATAAGAGGAATSALGKGGKVGATVVGQNGKEWLDAAAAAAAELEAMRTARAAADVAADEAKAAVKGLRETAAAVTTAGDAAKAAAAKAEAAAGAAQAAVTAAEEATAAASGAAEAATTAAVAAETAAAAATTAGCAATLVAAAANDAAAEAAEKRAAGTAVGGGAAGAGAAAEGAATGSLPALEQRLEDLAQQVQSLTDAAAAAVAAEPGGADGDAAACASGGRRPGSRTLKSADSGIQLGRVEDLDNKVNAVADQSTSTLAQLRGLADKVTELEKQLAAVRDDAAADAAAKVAAAAAAAADAAGGESASVAPSEMALKMVSEMEARLTRELGEALKELLGQAHDLEEIRQRLDKLEAAAAGAGKVVGAAALGTAGAAGAAGADGKPGGDGNAGAKGADGEAAHYVTMTEMQEVLDVVAQKMDGQNRQLRSLQRICDGLLGDLQEAARDVGQMTVQIKTVEEHYHKLVLEVEKIKRRDGGSDGDSATGAAVGAARAPSSASRRALRSARAEPSPGVVPPAGADPGAAASWESLMAADEAARMRDLELDQDLQEMAEQLEETKEGFHIKHETLQQILLKIARQVDKLQTHMNQMVEEDHERHAAAESQFRISNFGSLQATAQKILQSSRPTSPKTLAKMLASRPVSMLDMPGAATPSATASAASESADQQKQQQQ